MRWLLVLPVLGGCFSGDAGGGSGERADARPPPPDAAPPRCTLAAEEPVVCEGADTCPVREAVRAECQDVLGEMRLALAEGVQYVLVRVGADRLRAPQWFSVRGADIAELGARPQTFADRVVAPGGEALVITQPEAQTPILDSDGATVADPAGKLLDAGLGNDGRVHALYTTTQGALALASREVGGSWASVPVSDSVHRGSLLLAGSQPYALLTRDAEDAVRFQAPGEASVAITSGTGRVYFAAAFAAEADLPTAVTARIRNGHDHSLGGSVWFPDGSDFVSGSFSGLEEYCPTQCGDACSGSCVERGEQVYGSSPRAVVTADGRTWVIYLASRVERQVQLREDDNIILGCSCDHDNPTELGGELSLVLGTVEPPPSEGAPPELVERWRGPLPQPLGTMQMEVAASGDEVAVAVASSGSSEGHVFLIETEAL